MQMNDKVLTALEVLKDCAENDFERHRIDVLISDLTNPPKVEQIDDKHQKFNGLVYGLESNGHYARKFQIHRVISNYYYGEIPLNYDIHHKDLNKANNDISNLQILSKAEHQRFHAQLKNNFGMFRDKRKLKEMICQHCGKTFKTLTSQSKFCSKHCEYAEKWLKAKQNGKPKTCKWCGKNFCACKPTQEFCSLSCLSKWREQQKKINPYNEEIKNCLVCGTPLKSSGKNRLYCSNKCKCKFYRQHKKESQKIIDNS